MAVREGKKGQKLQFCPQKGPKTSKSLLKKGKKPTFVLRNANDGCWEAGKTDSCNSSATPLKCNYLVMRTIYFQGVPDEAKLISSATLVISIAQIINKLHFSTVAGVLHEQAVSQER